MMLTEPVETQKKVYEAPALIYEGQLTTRAGTVPGPIAGEGVEPIDPAGLFGNP